MKIFQTYYKEEQVVHLDSEFTPFFNASNPRPVDLAEYFIYNSIYNEAQKTNEDYWGHFSWQWKNKLAGKTAADILNLVNNNPGYDLYHFNAFPYDVVNTWNVWEQGQWCCPLMIELGEIILERMGEDPTIIRQKMDVDTYCTANYFIGNKKFWDGFLDFLHRYVDILGYLDGDVLAKLNTSAGYEPRLFLRYHGFICERLVSTYFLMNRDKLKIMPFNEIYPDHITGILELKKNNPQQWINLRTIHGDTIDWAKRWN